MHIYLKLPILRYIFVQFFYLRLIAIGIALIVCRNFQVTRKKFKLSRLDCTYILCIGKESCVCRKSAEVVLDCKGDIYVNKYINFIFSSSNKSEGKHNIMVWYTSTTLFYHLAHILTYTWFTLRNVRYYILYNAASTNDVFPRKFAKTMFRLHREHICITRTAYNNGITTHVRGTR